MVGVVLFLICLQEAHFSHVGWYLYERTVSFAPHQTMQYADAFRIGIPALIHVVNKVFHFYDTPSIYAVFDLVSGFLAFYLLYLLVVDIPPVKPDIPQIRVLKILVFLAALQLPMPWIIPQQRPETLPSTLFIAICLCCLAKVETSALWALPILAATLIQVFLRTDVPIAVGMAIAVIGLWSSFRGSKPGSSYIVIGALVTLIAGGVQEYFHLRYSHLKLDIQFRPNLNVHNLQVFALSLLPFVLFFAFSAIKRPPLTTIDKVVILSAVFYMPLYFVFGIVSEVRINVPFLLALCTVIARVSAPLLSSRQRTADETPS